MTQAYIVSALRTAGGRRGGRLGDIHPADLAAKALNGTLDAIDFDPALVDDVIMGCVATAGQQAHNIARNAIVSSRLPDSVPGTTVDRQCGSSQQALHFAAQAVMSGAQDIVIAAGVESMTRVPIGFAGRFPAEHGFGVPQSPTMLKRFEGRDISLFAGAEYLADKYNLSRDDLDDFSYQSHMRAIAATHSGAFSSEILPVAIETENGPDLHTVDEGIRFGIEREALSGLKVQREGGRITAGSSSQICDGASALLVVSEAGLKTLGVDPLARVVHMTVLGSDPASVLETPMPATDRALLRAGIKIEDIDLYEVNEAFASVPLAWIKHVGANPAKLNVNGGAIALGHPLGASGAKLMATLVHALKAHGGRYGLQAMCEGGATANVTIIERL